MRNGRVLVIDDTVRILNIVKFFLDAEGFTVQGTADPLQAAAAAREFLPDLIILDIMMPRMNGYQVYEKLRGQPETKETPIIMLTAQAVIETTPRKFFYGLYGVMAKPFTRAQLLRKVADILNLTDEPPAAEGA